VAAQRRLLLRDGQSLSTKQWRRLRSLFATDDPTGELLAAWAGKELLRQLLAEVDGGARPYELRARLDLFYRCAAEANVPELTRLAATIETWWPAVEAFLRLRITNARTEGYNRIIKQIKRVACGFRNQRNYEMRILLHNAALAA
jgi:transposase